MKDVTDIGWAGPSGQRYRLTQNDEGVTLSCGDTDIEIATGDLPALTQKLHLFIAEATAPIERGETREVDPNFPKRVRNFIFATVGVGVLILAYDIIANNRL